MILQYLDKMPHYNWKLEGREQEQLDTTGALQWLVDNEEYNQADGFYAQIITVFKRVFRTTYDRLLHTCVANGFEVLSSYISMVNQFALH